MFNNRSQMTSKCGKNNNVEHKAIAECVTDVLITFWRLLWPIIEQTYGNNYLRKAFIFQTLSTWLPESCSNTSPKWQLKWWLPCWFRHVGSTKTLLCASSRVHSSVSATCDYCVFKFLRRNMDGKHFIRFLVWTKNIWCVFRVKPPFSNSFGVVWTGPYWLMNVRKVKLLLPQSCSPAVTKSSNNES